MFLQNFQIPFVFPDRDFCFHFPCTHLSFPHAFKECQTIGPQDVWPPQTIGPIKYICKIVGLVQPYQKVIDYVNHFSHYRKTVSSICGLCLCVMVTPLYCQHTYTGISGQWCLDWHRLPYLTQADGRYTRDM